MGRGKRTLNVQRPTLTEVCRRWRSNVERWLAVEVDATGEGYQHG